MDSASKFELFRIGIFGFLLIFDRLGEVLRNAHFLLEFLSY